MAAEDYIGPFGPESIEAAQQVILDSVLAERDELRDSLARRESAAISLRAEITARQSETMAAWLERDELKAENDRLRRVVDSVRSRTALDIVAEKMAAEDARLAAEAEREEAIRDLNREMRAHERARVVVRSALADRDTLLEAIAAELTHCGIRDRIAQATAILGAETEKGSRARRAVERLDADRDAFYERMTAAVKRTGYTGGQDDA